MARGQRTHYDTLGVDRSASDGEIRSAFRKLALNNHPDRFEGVTRERAEKSFQAITEAFNVLSRPSSREQYDREIVAEGPTGRSKLDPAEIARKLAAKGAQQLKNGNVSEAVSDLQLALNHNDEDARAHYFLGQALVRVPGRAKDALRHLDRAARLNPENLVMKAEAAAAFAAAGMKSRATRLADEVLAIDPTNAKALSVLEGLDA